MSQALDPPSVETARDRLSTQSQGQENWIRKHVDLVLVLPPPGETWFWADIPERGDLSPEFESKFLSKQVSLRQHSIIKKVGTQKYAYGERPTDTQTRWEWETNGEAYRYAQSLRRYRIESGNAYPCKHSSGFITLDPGEEFACGFEFCEETFDSETVEAVMR